MSGVTDMVLPGTGRVAGRAVEAAYGLGRAAATPVGAERDTGVGAGVARASTRGWAGLSARH
ncbi:hypothetical protein GCM10010129_07030 [Streptomyces fumigatiscleroticus]|nr:hypothetical protein GCM10010129_07030 [Streptomyces fumigatiscleroticus]